MAQLKPLTSGHRAPTWRTVALAALAGAATLASAGCGPNLYWSKGKQPAWLVIDGARVKKTPAGIEAIGSSPATTRVQEDLQLAERDAKTQISTMLSSQISTRQLVWTMQVATNDKADDEQVVNQDIEVRSGLRLEDATVAATFRDKETRSAYVQLKVDTAAWAARIKKRVEGGLAEVASLHQRAQGQLGAGRALLAFKSLRAAYEAGARLGEDVRVLDVLASELRYGRKVADAKEKMDEFRRNFFEKTVVEIQVLCADPGVARATRGGLESFMKKNGFQVALPDQGGRSPIRIKAMIAQRALGTQQVGRRTEHVAGALAQLTVTQPDGMEVPELAISVDGRRQKERGDSAEQAGARALNLASESVLSAFRSKFRRGFATPTE